MKILINEDQFNSLNEALDIPTALTYSKIQRSPEVTNRIDRILKLINQKFPDSKFSKRGDRLYIKFGSELESEIKSLFNRNDYEIKNYDQGIARNNRTNQDVKFGKILVKLNAQDLLNKYNADKSRNSISDPSGYIVFSKHPYDIAGMSTGRNWSSCMDLKDGINRHYVSCDIPEGTFIVYFIDKNDLNIQKPKGRMVIKPFINKSDQNDIIFIPEDRVYGSVTTEGRELIVKLFEEINNQIKGSYYEKNPNLYNDSGSSSYINPKKLTNVSQVGAFIFNLDDLAKAQLALKNKFVFDYVMNNPKISHYTKESVIVNSNYDQIEKYMTSEYISKNIPMNGLDDIVEKFPQVKDVIIKNPEPLKKEHMGLLLKYVPGYIKNVRNRDIKNLSSYDFYSILYYNPNLYEFFYDNFKYKIQEDIHKLAEFLKRNPQYLIKSYPTIKSYLWSLSEYNFRRFVWDTLDKKPDLFVFYYNNFRKKLDEVFDISNIGGDEVYKNNRLFYLIYNYYPEFIDAYVKSYFKIMIRRNETLIPFFAKFYRNKFNDLNDSDIFDVLHYSPETIPYFIKYVPDVVRNMDRYYLSKIMYNYPDYTKEFQKIIS